MQLVQRIFVTEYLLQGCFAMQSLLIRERDVNTPWIFSIS